jgi:small multidrug resistance pump
MAFLPAIGAYPALALTIAAEAMATSMLKMSDSFTRPIPTVLTFVGYAVAFYFLSVSMRTLPTGIIYAIWSGVGIVLNSLIAWRFFAQRLDLPAVLGIGFILTGVLVLNLFSKSAAH